MKLIKNSALILLALLTLTACTRTKKEYFDDGCLKSSVSYRFGKENGTCEYYFINTPHVLKMRVEMKNGKRDGEFVKYFITGKVECKCTYKNDLIEGVEEVYDIHDYKVSSTTYLHGKKHGPFVYYHPNGEIMEQGSFDNDSYDGHWSYFDERGVLLGEGEYDKGTGVQKGYGPRGNVVRIINYKDNKKNGDDIELSEDGDTLKVIRFADDRIVSINGVPVDRDGDEK